jgi:hypothetical protein
VQTKLLDNSINAYTTVEAVASANLAIGSIGDTSIASTSDPTILVMNP